MEDITRGVPAIAIGVVLFGSFIAAVLWRIGNAKETPWFIAIAVFLGWFGPFLIIFFLPLDLSSSKYRTCLSEISLDASAPICVPPLIYMDKTTQRVIWQSIYWAMFGLTWFCLPILQMYMKSGGFTAAQCFIKAVKYNGWYYLTLGIIGAVAVGYIALAQKMEFSAIRSMGMALSNAYGLLLVVLLLSYGLVTVPRAIWHSADPRGVLINLEFIALSTKDQLDAAQRRLTATQQEVAILEYTVPISHQFRKYIDKMLVRVPANVRATAATVQAQNQSGGVTGAASAVRRWFSGGRSTSSATSPQSAQPTCNVTLKALQALHRDLNFNERTRNACLYKWERLVAQACFLQDVLDNTDNSDGRFHQVGHFRSNLLQRAQWIWYIRMRSWCIRTAALLAGALSIVVVWSEATQPFGLSALELIESTQSYMLSEAVAVSVMIYLSACVYIPLLKIRVFGTYSILPGHHTDVPSLLFFAGYMTRLAFPLGWNLLNLAGADAVFSQTMSSVKIVAPLLGPSFTSWIPVAMVALTGIVALNLHTKILSLCGVREAIDDDDDVAAVGEARADGRALLIQAKADLERRRLVPLGLGNDEVSALSNDPERGGLLAALPLSTDTHPDVDPRLLNLDDEFVPLGTRKNRTISNAAKRAAAAADLAASRAALTSKSDAPTPPPIPPLRASGPKALAPNTQASSNTTRQATFNLPKTTSNAFGALRNVTESGLRVAAAAATSVAGVSSTISSSNQNAMPAPGSTPSIAPITFGAGMFSNTTSTKADGKSAAKPRNMFDDI